MSYIVFRPEPGLYKNRSEYSAKNRWTDGNFVRFRDGTIQSIGGWIDTGLAVSGQARDCVAWRPNNLQGRYLAVGTNSGLFSYDGGSVQNITPSGFVAGQLNNNLGTGYGAGLYGASTYGTPRQTGSVLLPAANWTLDLWGETLAACYSTVGHYQWTPGQAVATPIANAPASNANLVTQERFYFAIGLTSNQRELAWSDQEDFETWTPLATNQAGSIEILGSSELVCGRRVGSGTLIFSKEEVYRFDYTTGNDVYIYDLLASRSGIVGPHAATTIGNVCLWQGQNRFWIYDGSVRELDCDVYDDVFPRLNAQQASKVFAATNAANDEIWFWQPVDGATSPSRAAVFNIRNNAWSYSVLDRCVWADRDVFDYPLAISSAGQIYNHELGETANGQPMAAFARGPVLETGTGETILRLKSIWPDFRNGNARFDIKSRFHPMTPETNSGPYQLNSANDRIMTCVTGRQMQVQVSTLSGAWELGDVRLDVQSGGKR